MIADPQMQFEPSDEEVRTALDGLPFPVTYTVTHTEDGLRVYRGRASRRGVPVRFAFLVGRGAASRVARAHFRLLPGRSNQGVEAPSQRLVYLSDDSDADRARRRVAYHTSFAIIDAVTAASD